MSHAVCMCRGTKAQGWTPLPLSHYQGEGQGTLKVEDHRHLLTPVHVDSLIHAAAARFRFVSPPVAPRKFAACGAAMIER
jgi:hypothetical protein